MVSDWMGLEEESGSGSTPVPGDPGTPAPTNGQTCPNPQPEPEEPNAENEEEDEDETDDPTTPEDEDDSKKKEKGDDGDGGDGGDGGETKVPPSAIREKPKGDPPIKVQLTDDGVSVTGTGKTPGGTKIQGTSTLNTNGDVGGKATVTEPLRGIDVGITGSGSSAGGGSGSAGVEASASVGNIKGYIGAGYDTKTGATGSVGVGMKVGDHSSIDLTGWTDYRGNHSASLGFRHTF